MSRGSKTLNSFGFWCKALIVAMGLMLSASAAWADDVSNAPQPINFPHYIHAGKFKIDCMYCHTYARRSEVSGIPMVAKCIGCHLHIPAVRNKPRIKKLFSYWKKKQPIPWLKVHDLPDFVYFPHMRHIQRFIFQDGRPTQQVCGMCHGDVKTFVTARKIRPLTMGWCLSCHRQFQGTSDIGKPAPAKNWMVPTSTAPLMQVDFPQPAVLNPEHPETMTHAEIAKLSDQLPETLREHLVRAPHDCWQCHK